jgi:hypothetical protein
MRTLFWSQYKRTKLGPNPTIIRTWERCCANPLMALQQRYLIGSHGVCRGSMFHKKAVQHVGVIGRRATTSGAESLLAHLDGSGGWDNACVCWTHCSSTPTRLHVSFNENVQVHHDLLTRLACRQQGTSGVGCVIFVGMAAAHSAGLLSLRSAVARPACW